MKSFRGVYDIAPEATVSQIFLSGFSSHFIRNKPKFHKTKTRVLGVTVVNREGVINIGGKRVDQPPAK